MNANLHSNPSLARGENSLVGISAVVGAALCRDFNRDIRHRGIKPLLQSEPGFGPGIHSLTLAATTEMRRTISP